MPFHMYLALANASDRLSSSSHPCLPSPSILSDSNGPTSRTERLSTNLPSLPGTTLFKCEVWKARVLECGTLVQDTKKDAQSVDWETVAFFFFLRVDGNLHLGVRADVIVWACKNIIFGFFFFAPFCADCVIRNRNLRCFMQGTFVCHIC